MADFILAVSRRTKGHDYADFEGALLDIEANELLPNIWLYRGGGRIEEAMKDLDSLLGTHDRYLVFEITKDAQWAAARVRQDAAEGLKALLDQ